MQPDGQDDGATRRPRDRAARHQVSRPAGRRARPAARSLRVQFHLPAEVVQRLGVHAALCHTDRSRVVAEILGGWLARYGRGREAFGGAPPSAEEGPPREP